MDISAETPARALIRQTTVAILASTACALFTVLLLSLLDVDGLPTLIFVFVGGLALLSAWKPDTALSFLAAAVPIAAWTGRWWHGRLAWPEVLAVAFAAGYAARTLWFRRVRRDDLLLPVAVFTSVVIASLAVRLYVLYGTIGGTALSQQLIQLAQGDYFTGSGRFRELDAAMRLIEGMVLLRAASTVAGEDSSFAPRLTRCFAVGAAAAAALNLWRLWQGAVRLEAPVEAFFRYLLTLRYNVHYADVNAAGSYFVMALLVAVGLTLATRRVGWAVGGGLVATSLVLSGSRSALLSGGLAGMAWFAGSLWRAHSRPTFRKLLGATALLVIAAAAAAVIVGMSSRSVRAATALQIRLELAETTFRMVKAHPLFGIGIGQYQEQSGAYSDDQLIETFRLGNENAHNNFFQVLGELGLAGTAAFLWVLGSASLRCARLAVSQSSAVSRGAVAGLLAFVLTWLSGHPLLIDEPALLFWLLLGTTAGWAGAVSPDATAGPGQARRVGVLIGSRRGRSRRADGRNGEASGVT